MGRRVVFQLDWVPDGKTFKLLASEGMRAAYSFASRLAAVATMPLTVDLYSSGSPFENGALYCDTCLRQEIRDNISKAKVISIRLALGRAPYVDAPDKPCATCEIYFKRDGKAFYKAWYHFDFTTGENIGSGGAGANMFQEPSDEEGNRNVPDIAADVYARAMMDHGKGW